MSPTHFAGRWSARAVGTALLAAALGLAIGLPALATASSGRIYKGENPLYLPNDICGEAIIRDIADNVGTTFATVNGSCWSPMNVLAGHIGVKVTGYRDGSYCGETIYVYNGGVTSGISVGSKLCSNPSGLKNFHSVSRHRAWNGSSYTYMGLVTSPSQTY
jgi:hypothetical protein